MVRHAHLVVALALMSLAGCAEQKADGPTYDPWEAHWSDAPERGVETAVTYVAWPTGDRDTADLSVEKHFPADPRPGRSFEAKLVITNLSDATLADLVLTERLGEAVELTASAPQGRSSEAGIYRWELGSVEAGQSRTIRLLGRVRTAEPISTSTSARYTREPGES